VSKSSSEASFADAASDSGSKPSPKQAAIRYSSILSDTFEGKIIGQVQCLECRNLSTTTESFMHLSLPIPTREYMQNLQAKVLARADDHEKVGAANSQGWLSWMADLVKGYIWTPTLKLQECLNAFFSEDELRGENMYSCEKCKK